MSQNTNIPGFPLNFQASLPVASQMDVWRPNWPHEINSTTKTVNGL
jgi:hypothetical protein